MRLTKKHAPTLREQSRDAKLRGGKRIALFLPGGGQADVAVKYINPAFGSL